MQVKDVVVNTGDWVSMCDDAMPIREAVFVREQGVPLEEEIDSWDPVCLHAVAYDAQGQTIATGRLLPDGHIGRMAVSSHARGRKIGSLVLVRLIEEARLRGDRMVVLHAQTHALAFYEKHGFRTEGEMFFEANISHYKMFLRLA